MAALFFSISSIAEWMLIYLQVGFSFVHQILFSDELKTSANDFLTYCCPNIHAKINVNCLIFL